MTEVFLCVCIHLLYFTGMIPAWLPPFKLATKILGTVGEELHPFLYLNNIWYYGMLTVQHHQHKFRQLNACLDSLLHCLLSQSINFHFSIISLSFHSISSQTSRQNFHKPMKGHLKKATLATLATRIPQIMATVPKRTLVKKQYSESR